MGRVASRTLPLGQRETFTYDNAGNRTGHVDFNSASHTFAFDDLNRQTTATYADGITVTTTYTDTGQVDTITDDRGATDFDYDERERLTRITYPTGRTIDYGYDDTGNRTSLTTTNQSLTYTFDVLNRLATVVDEAGTTTYGYDAVGNRASLDYANGTRTTYVYDPLYRLTELNHFDTLNVLMDRHTYTLGDNGNRLQHAELNGRTVDYTYDDLYRLLTETVTDPTLGNRSAGWTYDAVGNRLTQVETDVSGTTTTTYVYDNNDRIGSETAVGAAPSTTTYTYDNNGNTLTEAESGVTTNYAYDSRNRLINLNTGQVTYRYDASGIRMSETAAGLTTHYLVDPNRDYAQVIEESFDLNAFAEVRYTYGDDLVAQHRRTSSTTTESRTFHYDGLGSTRLLTDTAGATTDTYAFRAFGELEGSTGVTVNDYLYTGEQYDLNLGFYYLRARYYNPAIGRFPTMDPFGGFTEDPFSIHRYLYANVNPVSNVDPSGELSVIGVSIRTAFALLRSPAGRNILRQSFSASAKRSSKRNGLLVLAALAGAGSAIHTIVTQDERSRGREPKITLFHGTSSNAASKIVRLGFRSVPVFFAEDIVTARVFAAEAAGRNDARSTTVITFTIPLSIAEAAGIGPESRQMIGSEFGLPFVDISGGSGYERVIRSTGELLIFNGALTTGKITTRRLRF
ncbi:MAG: RHS repeat-associated core domain-containing protein [Pseudomonadota bacterium]